MTNIVGKESKKYSLYGRTPNHLLLTTIRQNPGPGAYTPAVNINKDGKYFVSSIKSSGAPSFSLPSLERFKVDNRTRFVPGPGQYDLKIGIGDPTSTFMSNFKSPKTRTFYHADRKTIDIPDDHKKFPGPGNYRQPSEFGQYESKHFQQHSQRACHSQQSIQKAEL